MSDNNPTPGDGLVERLRGLLAKATPVPWEFDGCSLSDFGREYPCSMSMEWIPNTFDSDDDAREKENGELMAAAVNALPALLDELEALRTRDEASRSSTTGEVERAVRDVGSKTISLDAACEIAREALQAKDHSHAG
jgi:hypothetical protein